MDPLGYMPFYEKPEFLAEIDLRGRFMMMACDIEWNLLNIIMFSAEDPLNHPRANQFKGMRMNAKIEAVLSDIKKIHPKYYQEYKEAFDQLLEFKELRNDMGHYPLEFDDDSLKSFTMRFIDNVEGYDRVQLKTYTVEFISDAVKRFRKANIQLMELVQRLKSDYDAKIAAMTLDTK